MSAPFADHAACELQVIERDVENVYKASVVDGELIIGKNIETDGGHYSCWCVTHQVDVNFDDIVMEWAQ